MAVEDVPPSAARRTPRRYESGSLAGIPESGRERIERMKQEVARGFFTSDLSINEFLLVKQAGFEPLGLVLGSSIYHIGFQQASWSQNQEMGVLTQAMYHARELAMTRMEEEADQLGADGVVGVRLDIGRYEWGAELAEFIAVGTAVKHRGGELHRAAQRPAVHLGSERPGLLDAAARRLSARWAGDGQLRLPRRPPGPARQRGSRSGATRRCPTTRRRCTRRASWRMERMQTEADGAPGERDRRRPDHRAQPRLGLARDRVLRDRHGGRGRSATTT